MVMEQNNENAPKPGHLTPKKSRCQNPEENYTPRDLRRSNDLQDIPSAASPVSQTPMSPIRIALQDWELSSPASRPIPNLPRYQPRVPRPLTSSSSKPMVDVNVVREHTSEFLVLREPYHSLSPSRKAFQELNFSSR
ncbi:uncharacterized protein LOC135463220 [Liolophura sinensis]|uniref:uncharacterized protein LOC135463220 n=1 Tax=Liolophura sinensis TaxID=3198878 RepID=UPI0031583455